MLKISVVKGNNNSISITANNDGHKSMATKVKAGVLYISQNGRAQLNFTPSLTNIHKEIIDQEIIITTKNNIDMVSLSGFSFVKFKDNINNNFVLKAEDSSNFEANFNCESALINLKSNAGADISGNIKKLKVECDSSVMRIYNCNINVLDIFSKGKSRITASGNANTFMLTISGKSRFEGLELKTLKSQLNVDNQSDVFLKVSDYLDLTAKNKSHIVCVGKPTLKQNVTPDCKIKIR
ncbi:MAG: DUF2807 domain-containing protein [Bacteroidales bacterium]|nr:DUF2807 domain-containing protein [Bacteroidales bacterium]